MQKCPGSSIDHSKLPAVLEQGLQAELVVACNLSDLLSSPEIHPNRLELDNLAAFMRGAVDYKKKIGFKGALLLEPKPQARNPGSAYPGHVHARAMRAVYD